MIENFLLVCSVRQQNLRNILQHQQVNQISPNPLLILRRLDKVSAFVVLDIDLAHPWGSEREEQLHVRLGPNGDRVFPTLKRLAYVNTL